MPINGSASLAHNLDRFANKHFDYEVIMITAAQFAVDPELVAWYLDLFGDDLVTVEFRQRVQTSPQRVTVQTVREVVPAFVAHLRRDNVPHDTNLKIFQ